MTRHSFSAAGWSVFANNWNFCNHAFVYFLIIFVFQLSSQWSIDISDQWKAQIHTLYDFSYFRFIHTSITSFACSCLDVSKTTCFLRIYFNLVHWSTWSYVLQSPLLLLYIFTQWLYFSDDLGCAHNLSSPFTSSIHFIFNNFAFTWFFSLVFQICNIVIKFSVILLYSGYLSFFNISWSSTPWILAFFIPCST